MRRRDFLRSSAAVPLLASGMRARAARPDNDVEASWAEIDRRPVPSWYTDAKFGIFIHWGVYSVPAYAAVNVKDENPYAEWYWHSLTEGKKAAGPTGHGALTWAFHQRTYGANFPYFDFAPLFKAELYEPERWAELFAASGAKYVALTSKHHDGFTLWRSAEANRSWGRPWNSVDTGPRRDLVGDLMQAGRRKGLHMGIYYSLYEWYNPLWLSDRKRFVSEHLFPQFKDVVTHAEPAIIFSDGEWEMTSSEWRSPELLRWLIDESPVKDEVVMDDRWGKDTRHKHGGYYTTEYTSGMQNANHPWEENRGMGFSYGYNRMETLQDYRSERELILMLADIVSRNGNLLLDIGPRADGGIPVVMEERLRQMGAWLKANGDAIYGTKAWRETREWSGGEVPKMEEKEFRAEYDVLKLVDHPAAGQARVEAFFTAKGNDVYAIVPRWPERPLELKGVKAGGETAVTLLETGAAVRWTAAGNGIRLDAGGLDRAQIPFRQAYVFRLSGVS